MRNQDNAYVVVVRVTDPDGMPEAAAAVPANSDEITVTIEVTEVNEAPDITGEAAVSFAENDPIGTVLDSYTADDPEETPAPTLALAGADRGKFDFNTTNGPTYVQGRARLRETGGREQGQRIRGNGGGHGRSRQHWNQGRKGHRHQCRRGWDGNHVATAAAGWSSDNGQPYRS